MAVCCPKCNALNPHGAEICGDCGQILASDLRPPARIVPESLPLPSQKGIMIMDCQPMWIRPISATLGRLSAPLTALMLGTTAPFKPGPNSSDEEVLQVTEGFTKGNTDDQLELQLGSSMPLRNIKRIWMRKGLGNFGKLTGTLIWPISEMNKALSRLDCYDPFAHSVALYHKDLAILVHELGHAEDYAKRQSRTLYIYARAFPPVLLYQEWTASKLAIDNLIERGMGWAVKRTNRVLGGGFGSYIGLIFKGVGALFSALIGQLVGSLFNPFGRTDLCPTGIPPKQFSYAPSQHADTGIPCQISDERKIMIEEPTTHQLQKLRNIAGEDAVGFAHATETEWICVCGMHNFLNKTKHIQNCRACHRNRNFALTHYTRQKIMGETPSEGFSSIEPPWHQTHQGNKVDEIHDLKKRVETLEKQAIILAIEVAIVSGLFTIYMSITGTYGYTLWTLIDAGIIFVLAYGISKKSRICSIILFVHYLVGRVDIYKSTGALITAFGLVSIAITIVYFLAIIGTFYCHASNRRIKKGIDYG